MQIRSVGIDLGKTTFHLVALGDNGKVLLKKKFTQKQLNTFRTTGIRSRTRQAHWKIPSPTGSNNSAGRNMAGVLASRSEVSERHLAASGWHEAEI